MSSVFKITEHTLECQHVREYARATANSQEDVLHLAIKQYTPLDNPHPKPGHVTIIGAHANGFAKEMYEPLWKDLHTLSKTHGFTIRSIWIADFATQGASGVLNENKTGNDPSWMDHARDLLHLTNVFRAEMPRPLVGIGHSFGANMLVNLSLMHPRLLSTLILLDPVIQKYSSVASQPNIVQLSAFRRDTWPSRSAASDLFRGNKFYQAWDPRVLDRWLEFGLREGKEGEVTLTTRKDQECFAFLRPSWEAVAEDQTILKPELVPDMNPDNPGRFPFYRPEPPATLARIGALRPSVMYIFGELSDMSGPEWRKEKLDATGSSYGGSGGVKAGRVKHEVLLGKGHLVAMEAVDQCARISAEWLEAELKRYEKEQKEYEEWAKKSMAEKSTMSEQWKKRIGGPPVRAKGKL